MSQSPTWLCMHMDAGSAQIHTVNVKLYTCTNIVFFFYLFVLLPVASRCVLGVQVGFKKGEENHRKQRHLRGNVLDIKGAERWKVLLEGAAVWLLLSTLPGHQDKADVHLRPDGPVKVSVPQICDGPPGGIDRRTHHQRWRENHLRQHQGLQVSSSRSVREGGALLYV